MYKKHIRKRYNIFFKKFVIGELIILKTPYFNKLKRKTLN